MVFPYESELTVAMDDELSTLLAEEVCPLTALALTPRVPVSIKLAVAFLAGSGDVLIFRSRTFREKLNIKVIERAFESGVEETIDQVIVRKKDPNGGISARYTSVSLSVVQQITNREEFSKKDESFKGILLVRGPAMMELEYGHGHMLLVEALTAAPRLAVQEVLPVGLLQEM